MAYERALYIKSQIVMGVWDDDGNLIDKWEGQEIKDLCYPFGTNLETYVHQAERGSLPRREEVRR